MISKAVLQWATIGFLLEPETFMTTKYLVELDQKRRTNHRQWLDSLHQTRRWEYPWLLRSMAPWRETDMVVDAGCSDTAFPYFVAQHYGCQVIGIDVDAAAIDAATRKNNLVNLTYGVQDMRETAIVSDAADKVLCISVLEHLPRQDWRRAFDELLRFVKPGGLLGITLDIGLSDDSRQALQGLLGGLLIPDAPGDTIVFSLADVAPYCVLGMVMTKGGSR